MLQEKCYTHVVFKDTILSRNLDQDMLKNAVFWKKLKKSP